MTAPRGRPKTLDRQKTLDIAMDTYWSEGVEGISLNEVCRRAKISKPGLYREFGGEDGLMKAVLNHYQQQVLSQVLQLLETDAPFQETLDTLVSFVTSSSDAQEVAKGCLLVKMRNSRMQLGEETRKQLEQAHRQQIKAFEQWLERLRSKGEFSVDMTTTFAATYIVAQLSHALSQIALGEDSATVEEILVMALSVFVH